MAVGGDADEGRANWMRHASAIRILRHVVTALGAEGIPVLPVKGVITAHGLYEDVALRRISDIDLRVRRSDYKSVLRIARAHGWSPMTESPALWEALLKVEGCDVDVECTLGPPGLCALSVDEVIERARAHVAPFGFPHLQPESNDHALILVLNAFKDGLRPMPWAREDLVRIARQSQFDGNVLVARAHRGRVRSALWIVAHWLAEDHGAAEWARVRDLIGPRPPSRRVAEVFRYVRGRGWPQKAGLFAAACGGDGLWRCATGFTLTVTAIARRRALLARQGRKRADPRETRHDSIP